MHNMASGNKMVGNSKGSQWGDRSEKNLLEKDSSPVGLEINAAAQEADINKTTRALRPLTFRVLRYLITGVLAFSCALGKESSVKALKSEANLAWCLEHVAQDFRLIQKLCDRSPEETWLLLHMIIAKLPTMEWGMDLREPPVMLTPAPMAL